MKPKQARAEPTVNALLAAAMSRVEAGTDEELRIDDMLAETGVSRGSLYHHFGDRQGLLDAARATLFQQMVVSDLQRLQALAELEPVEIVEQVQQLNEQIHAPSRAPNRLTRALVIGRAGQGSSADAIASQQDAYTEALAGVLESLQSRGVVRGDLDPMAVAVFFQAAALGRVVDDIASEKVDPEAWVRVVNTMTRALIGPDVPDDDVGSGS